MLVAIVLYQTAILEIAASPSFGMAPRDDMILSVLRIYTIIYLLNSNTRQRVLPGAIGYFKRSKWFSFRSALLNWIIWLA